ncbi:MAG: cofactor-independent phosphoglycerate mutase [Candidatus Omnitrophica bacterium]|nr:cofactor-independent phosphoglycerate mutase [Candidatus Omnitrophota bacterium]MCM8827443.1 cofactor-independent phosphoglycerate mutase [Candidatus Omnitrophota bacterium]
MKYIVIVPDGASDYPIDSLGGKTPLEVADIPFMHSLAKEGIVGRVRTVPTRFLPSSDVANLSLLGYEPEKYYTSRGPLEAANLNIEVGDKDIVFRCNLITESDGNLFDYSAGHISDKEAKVLIEELNKYLGSEEIRFYPGKSYRHIMVYKNSLDLGLDKLICVPPHDIMGGRIVNNLPKGRNSKLITNLMLRSKEILSGHSINKVRIDLKENPANMIWLWGGGRKPQMEKFRDKFGIEGAVISAVDLIKGIGKIIGLRVVEVEGATGYYDTNYLGKAYSALEALEDVDFVFIHIEATDEAGHNQDLRMKITCLERIDKLVVGTIVDNLKNRDYRILITPDHPTPIVKRTHTNEPVPFLISGKGIEKGNFSFYCESEAQNSSFYFERGVDLLKFFLER